ncbi:Cytochrome c domain-containing protein [Sphingomonas antarctica]|uniref:SO2930 family diheme c-type cytochrome n=1 Tax=Sphingomonas antarctica TaxID=2040274 RepID=UPI0039ED67B1
MKRALAALLLLGTAPLPQVDDALITGDTLPPKLSDYRFFNGGAPNARVTAYHLNTTLFSDYTDKDRWFYLPPNTRVSFDAAGTVQFPQGAAIIKTFRYGDRKLETRVLLHRGAGWQALPYVWDGADAVLKRGGTRLAATVKGQAISYAVPNVNQCKECHQTGALLTPIGPKARNIDDGQLVAWQKAGLVNAAPAVAKLPRWDDPTQPIALRARAYLEVNCAHCHKPEGSASNSGLYLGWDKPVGPSLGIGKSPVAAGRGSGGRMVAIDPGHPEASIMTYRMASTEPGVAMPELGRATVHTEGVALIANWIAAMR